MRNRNRSVLPVRRRDDFSLLPRRRQMEQWIRVKNWVRRFRSHYEGEFFTRNYLHPGMSWADIFFLGPAKPAFYRATVLTAAEAYRAACEALAYERSFALVPPQPVIAAEQFGEKRWDSIRREHYFEWNPPRITHESFGGITRAEWVELEQRMIANSGDICVHAEAQAEWSTFGNGLRVVVDEPALSAASLAALVRRFRDAGYRPYRDPQPLTFTADQVTWEPAANAVLPMSTPYRIWPQGARDRAAGAGAPA